MDNGLRNRFAEITAEKLSALRDTGHEVHPYVAGTTIEADKGIFTHLDVAALENSEVIHSRLASLRSLDTIPLFDHSERPFLNNLRFYVVAVDMPNDRRVFCFRAREWVKSFETNRTIVARLTTGEYNKYDVVEDRPLIFDEGVDIFMLEDDLFVIDSNAFSKVFPKFEPVLAQAEDVLSHINERFTIDGYDELLTDCKRDRRKMGKLNSIIKSEHFKHLDFTKLQATCAKHHLGDMIQPDSNGGFKVVYDPKQKWKILKLLNDDYVSSSTTDTNYEIIGNKRRT